MLWMLVLGKMYLASPTVRKCVPSFTKHLLSVFETLCSYNNGLDILEN